MTQKLPQRRKKVLDLLRHFLSLYWVRDVFMYLVRIIERMEGNHIFLSAAGLSFNALLCFIPLVLLVFYALGLYLGTEEALATVERSIQDLDLFPYQREQLQVMVLNLIREFLQGSQLAGIIGGIGLLWTSSALFAALRTVLNKIFHARDTLNIFASKLRDFAMLSVVGVALIVVTVFMYTISLIKGIGHNVFGMELDSWIFNDAVNAASPFVLSFILFLLVFSIVPDKRQKARVVFLASIIAAILWGAAKVVFSYYLQNLWKIGAVYGPYAIIVATAIWVYYSSVTLLFAAEVGQMYEERKTLRNLFTEDSLSGIVQRTHRGIAAQARDTPGE